MTRGVAGLLASMWLGVALAAQPSESTGTAGHPYLSWPVSWAETIAERAYVRGRVGSVFDPRLLKTERAINYKLAATLLTPSVIRATARVLQARSRLTPEQTDALVVEAEAARGLVAMVEIDPRQGSGVIPPDWEAFLQPEGQPSGAVRGVNTPELRTVKALAGVLRRNYDFDRFWVVFPNDADAAYMKAGVQTIELVVRIHQKEGRVAWPASMLRAE